MDCHCSSMKGASSPATRSARAVSPSSHTTGPWTERRTSSSSSRRLPSSCRTRSVGHEVSNGRASPSQA